MLSMKKNLRNLAALLLLASLAIGIVATGGCTTIAETISAQEAFDLIQENAGSADFVIIDVRTPEEFTDGHIAGAIVIDFYSMSFRNGLDVLDKDKTYLIYCRSGNRSGQARDIMEELGFKEVYDLGGGIVAWINAGLPTTTESVPTLVTIWQAGYSPFQLRPLS